MLLITFGIPVPVLVAIGAVMVVGVLAWAFITR